MRPGDEWLSIARTSYVRMRVIYKKVYRQYPYVIRLFKIWIITTHALAVNTRPSLSCTLLGPCSWSCNFAGCGLYIQLRDASDVHKKSSNIRMELIKSFLKHFTLHNLETNNLYPLLGLQIRPPVPLFMLTTATTKPVLTWSISGRWINTNVDNDIRYFTHIALVKVLQKIMLGQSTCCLSYRENIASDLGLHVGRFSCYFKA